MQGKLEMVFCLQNCSDLLWEKNCSSDQEKRLKFKAEGREFAKCLRSPQQFIGTVKCQNIFWNRLLFKLITGGLSYLMNQNN